MYYMQYSNTPPITGYHVWISEYIAESIYTSVIRYHTHNCWLPSQQQQAMLIIGVSSFNLMFPYSRDEDYFIILIKN